MERRGQRRKGAAQHSEGRIVKGLSLAKPGETLSVLCLGAHSDDIEIGAGGLLLSLIASGAELDVHWCVASATGGREDQAPASTEAFLEGATAATVSVGSFRDSYLPY